MAKKVVSHLPPRHMDDTLAILVLKASYPEAEVEFVHPQDEEKLKEYRENPEILLVDVGGEYNSEKGNFDHHQDVNIPSSIKLVLQGKEENLSENAKRFIEIVDEIDRKGFPETAKKYNLPRDMVVAELQRVFLELAGNPKVIEKMVNPERGEEQFFEFLNKATEDIRIPISIKVEDKDYTAYYNASKDEIEYSGENEKEIREILGIDYVKEKIRENAQRGLITYVEKDDGSIGVIEGERYNPIMTILGNVNQESFKNPYTAFAIVATSVDLPQMEEVKMKLPKEEIEKKAVEIAKELERKQKILESVEITEIMGRKTIIDYSETPLRAGEYFAKYKDAELLIQRNTMNKEHTSIVKNTNNPQTADLNLDDFYKIFGEDKKVFTHKAGFITVVNMPLEEVVNQLKGNEFSNKQKRRKGLKR